jgi:hypothetical protein
MAQRVHDQPPDHRITRARRIVLVVAATLSASAISWVFWSRPQPSPSDFAQVWYGARGLLAGLNPYDLVGPGRAFEWRYPLLYPLPAVLAGVPFALLPLRLVDPIFVGLSTGLLVVALTRHTLWNPQLLVLVSVPFLLSLQLSQWSPLLVGAALTPGFGVLLACKPTTAFALLVAFPNLRTIIAIAVVWLASLLVLPRWPIDWLAALPSATHMVPAVLQPGGVLILLALLRWREPEARLLVALACVPHTLGLYDTVPLFLVTRRWWEAGLLCALSGAAYVGWHLTAWESFAAFQAAGARWAVWLMYLPCTAFVLRRSPERSRSTR